MIYPCCTHALKIISIRIIHDLPMPYSIFTPDFPRIFQLFTHVLLTLYSWFSQFLSIIYIRFSHVHAGCLNWCPQFSWASITRETSSSTWLSTSDSQGKWRGCVTDTWPMAPVATDLADLWHQWQRISLTSGTSGNWFRSQIGAVATDPADQRHQWQLISFTNWSSSKIPQTSGTSGNWSVRVFKYTVHYTISFIKQIWLDGCKHIIVYYLAM